MEEKVIDSVVIGIISVFIIVVILLVVVFFIGMKMVLVIIVFLVKVNELFNIVFFGDLIYNFDDFK